MSIKFSIYLECINIKISTKMKRVNSELYKRLGDARSITCQGQELDVLCVTFQLIMTSHSSGEVPSWPHSADAETELRKVTSLAGSDVTQPVSGGPGLASRPGGRASLPVHIPDCSGHCLRDPYIKLQNQAGSQEL